MEATSTVPDDAQVPRRSGSEEDQPARRPRRPRSDALRNRAAIVAAAAAELRRAGALNMQRVAAAAGLSRSTLHRHFPTRSSLEDALREDALAEARRAVEGVTSQQRAPLAMLRDLVGALVDVASERRFDVLDLLPLGHEGEDVGAAMLPAVDRLRRAAEVGPSPSPDWLRKLTGHLLEACLDLGSSRPDDPRAAAEGLFRSLTEPLDQGLVVLDPDGAVVCINPRAARVLDPTGRVGVG
jgi:AcrR family transcriptional regulator